MTTTPEPVVFCNLEQGGRRRRMTGGILIAAFTLAGLVALHTTHAPLLWRAALVLPWFGAATGMIQALHGTCIALAATGMRESATGLVRESDPAVLAATRKRAGLVRLQAALVAAALTALGFAWR